MLPKPERSVEQTKNENQQQRPTEQTRQDVDSNERHGRAGEPLRNRVKYGHPGEAEGDGQDDDHVNADKAHHSAKGRSSRSEQQQHQKRHRKFKRGEGGRRPPACSETPQ